MMDDTPQPTPPRLNFAPNYDALAMEAHRRYATSFRPPASIWHVAVWPKWDDHWLNLEALREQETKRAKWRRAINETIKGLQPDPQRYFGGGDKAGDRGLPGDVDPKDDAVTIVDPESAITLHSILGLPWLSARVEHLSEHASFTFYISYADCTAHSDGHSGKALARTEHVHQMWEKGRHALSGYSADAGSDDDLAPIHALYSDVWDVLVNDDGFQLPGEIFTHFRGLTIPAADCNDPGDAVNDRCFVRKKAPEFLRRQTRLINSLYKRDGGGEHRETIANTVLRDRALYASSLGAPIASSAQYGDEDKQHSAMRYLLIYAAKDDYEGDGRAQLARLAQRLHNLGRLRMLSLRDYRTLRRLSRRLHEIGIRLNKLYEEDTTPYFLKPNDVKTFAKTMNDIERGSDPNTRRPLGGLSYRIYRSLYYAERFKRLLEDLNIERIEGWQPYNEFMRRRYYSHVDFIRSIGDRFTALRSRFEEALEVAETARAASLQDSANAIAESSLNIQRIGVVIAFFAGVFALFEMLNFFTERDELAAVLSGVWRYLTGA